MTTNFFQDSAYSETKPDLKKEKKMKRQTIATTKVQIRKPGVDKLLHPTASLRYYSLLGTKSLCGDELRTMCFFQQVAGKKGLHGWASIS